MQAGKVSMSLYGESYECSACSAFKSILLIDMWRVPLIDFVGSSCDNGGNLLSLELR